MKEGEAVVANLLAWGVYTSKGKPGYYKGPGLIIIVEISDVSVTFHSKDLCDWGTSIQRVEVVGCFSEESKCLITPINSYPPSCKGIILYVYPCDPSDDHLNTSWKTKAGTSSSVVKSWFGWVEHPQGVKHGNQQVFVDRNNDVFWVRRIRLCHVGLQGF